MKDFKLFFEGMEEDDYRGLHRAPRRGEGSPLYDVSGTYPDDIYTLPLATAARYYGHSDPSDMEALSIIQRMHNRPNGTLKIYRAVPNINKEIDVKLKRYGSYIWYVSKYGFAPMKDMEASSIWVGSGYNKDKFIERVSEIISDLELKKSKVLLRINAGDWVTTVRSYAIEHGRSSLLGSYKILTKTVPAKHLFTDGNSVYEFGYDPS